MSSLHRLYISNGIRRKTVRIQKSEPPADVHNFEEQRQKVLDKMTSAKNRKLPVAYLDEIVFSKRAMLTRTWSNPKKHIKVDSNTFYIPYKAVIAAVNAEKKLVHIKILDSSANPDNIT